MDRDAGPGSARRILLVAPVAIAVAVAFADSSIVVLALPELYARFDTTIAGVAWVVTAFNVAVAVVALAIVVVRRARARILLVAGSLLFLGASVACALAGSLGALVVARSVQGAGAALLLAGSLPVLGDLAGSAARGVAIWTMAGTFGAALGPALGGALTQAFDWRAIFVAQAPVAGAALLVAAGSRAGSLASDRVEAPLRLTVRANAALALVFGALAGTLFLGVLLVVDVFGYPPIRGAAMVTLIPAAALAVRPLAARLPFVLAVRGGATLLAAGLLGLALLPSSDPGYALASFGLCGAGLGLCVPDLTSEALGESEERRRAGAFTVGVRHLGLVLSLAVVAPLLASHLLDAARVAELNATAVIVDGRIPATTKVPLALDIRDALDRAPRGAIPDLSAAFEAHGSVTDEAVRVVQDDVGDSIATSITRGFRASFLFCALLAVLVLPIALVRRRGEP